MGGGQGAGQTRPLTHHRGHQYPRLLAEQVGGDRGRGSHDHIPTTGNTRNHVYPLNRWVEDRGRGRHAHISTKGNTRIHAYSLTRWVGDRGRGRHAHIPTTGDTKIHAYSLTRWVGDRGRGRHAHIPTTGDIRIHAYSLTRWVGDRGRDRHAHKSTYPSQGTTESTPILVFLTSAIKSCFRSLTVLFEAQRILLKRKMNETFA